MQEEEKQEDASLEKHRLVPPTRALRGSAFFLAEFPPANLQDARFTAIEERLAEKQKLLTALLSTNLATGCTADSIPNCEVKRIAGSNLET